MSTARIKKTIPNTDAKIQKTLDEINKEFKVEFTRDEVSAIDALGKEEKKKLVHYPQNSPRRLSK